MENHEEDDDNFPPVAQMRTVRLILAVAAQLNMELVTMDFPKAFLLGKMDAAKPICMFAPEGFGNPGEIWRICLPLYGLTISSRRFYESLSEFMRAVGFSHFAGGDPCLFRRTRLLPNATQAQINNTKSVGIGLQGRPLEKTGDFAIPDVNGATMILDDDAIVAHTLPRGPQPSRIGPPNMPTRNYPKYMDEEEYKSQPNVDFEPHHAVGLAPDAMNGLFPGTYYELAITYVDDLLGATHEAQEMAAEFIQRFQAKNSPPGSMYLGLNYEQNLLEGWIAIGFKTCLERTMERIQDQTPEEIGIRSLVGILLWVTLHIFGTHLVEVKSLARRTNQNLPEDGKTALALIFELYARRGQRIFYHRNADTDRQFVPRSSRIAGVADVSKFHGEIPAANGEVMVTPNDILEEDDGIDIYIPDSDEILDVPEHFEIDHAFEVTVPTDASYAPDQMSRRSDLGTMVCLNGGPIDWSALRMTGIADSSFNAEYCAMSMGTKRTIPVSEMLRFMGIQHPPVIQYCDSITSATQVARNPHRMGAARSLGIRMHATRYAIAHDNLILKYSITEDMLADILTKRMPRKKLARLSVVFFNNLRPDWFRNPDYLQPLRDVEWYPELQNQPELELEQDYYDTGWESEEEEDDDPENIDPNAVPDPMVVVLESEFEPPGIPAALPVSIEIHENRLRVQAQLLTNHRRRILRNTQIIRATMENLLMPEVVTPYSRFDFQLWHDVFNYDWEHDENEFRRLDENTVPD
jgi:hypothetical protein